MTQDKEEIMKPVFMVTEEEARKFLGIAKNFIKAISDYLCERSDS